MIIKEKMALLLKTGAVIQNGSRVEPLWLHFFFSVRLHKIDSMFYLRNFWKSYARAKKNNTNSKNYTLRKKRKKIKMCNFSVCVIQGKCSRKLRLNIESILCGIIVNDENDERSMMNDP